ncbi:MAG TPA: hypothetical protein VFH47_08275, partial [Candidatus Thermoplasmatota archaeon]|nr:hypothetical protein [Candidatus Thermoplasmatota archaeon]
ITLACQDVARWQASKRASPAGLPFPLYAGQRWTTQNGGTTQEWVVAGRETVDVQAGQFRTVRIVVTPRNAQGTAGAEWTLHYAPEAKAIVLSEGQPGGLGPPLAFAAMPTPAEGVRHGVVRAELVHLDLGQKVSGNPLPHRLWPDCTRFPVTPTARPPTLDEVVVRVTPGIDPHLADARVDQPLRFAATNVWDGLVVEWLPSDDLDLDADGGTSATVTPTAIGTHALSARLVAPNGTRGPAATAYVTVDPPELGARIACLGANEVPAYQPTCDPVSFQVGHGRVILDAQVQGTPCATMTLHDPAGVERTRVRGKEGLWLRIDERPDAAGTWTVRYEPHGLLLSDPEVHIRVDHMAPGGHTNLSQWTPQPC